MKNINNGKFTDTTGNYSSVRASERRLMDKRCVPVVLKGERFSAGFYHNFYVGLQISAICKHLWFDSIFQKLERT